MLNKTEQKKTKQRDEKRRNKAKQKMVNNNYFSHMQTREIKLTEKKEREREREQEAKQV